MNRLTACDRLAPRGPLPLMYRIYRYVLPEVRTELKNWRRLAESIPDPELKKQALASIATKQFHCEGGSIYAAANVPQRHVLIPLIVAFQTISDYLDNLCDRSTSLDPADFRLLHQAMLDAVDPVAPLGDYYALRQEKADGGYLAALVQTCQACIRKLPSYALVAAGVRELTGLYGDLQVYKHITLEQREDALFAWWSKHRVDCPDIRWNEFAAAAGSTLGVFMLFLAASDPELGEETVRNIRDGYFPYVCSLHILLDYLIDQEEDRIGGDLNFCHYYENAETALQRIAYMAEQARTKVAVLQRPAFHRMVIEGLLAVYLSDPKVISQRQVRGVAGQLMLRSPLTRLFFWFNSIWVRFTS